MEKILETTSSLLFVFRNKTTGEYVDEDGNPTDEIYEAVKPLLDQDCIVLIKGSRAMKMDTLVDAFRGKKQ